MLDRRIWSDSQFGLKIIALGNPAIVHGKTQTRPGAQDLAVRNPCARPPAAARSGLARGRPARDPRGFGPGKRQGGEKLGHQFEPDGQDALDERQMLGHRPGQPDAGVVPVDKEPRAQGKDVRDQDHGSAEEHHSIPT